MNSAIDYGEPLTPAFGNAFRNREGRLESMEWRIRDRAIATINACAGMADPEKEISELRKELAHQTDMGCQAHVCGGARIEELQRENIAMREAIREAGKLIDRMESSARSPGNLPMCPECLRIAAWDENHRDDCQIGNTLAKLQPFLK